MLSTFCLLVTVVQVIWGSADNDKIGHGRQNDYFLSSTGDIDGYTDDKQDNLDRMKPKQYLPPSWSNNYESKDIGKRGFAEKRGFGEKRGPLEKQHIYKTSSPLTGKPYFNSIVENSEVAGVPSGHKTFPLLYEGLKDDFFVYYWFSHFPMKIKDDSLARHSKNRGFGEKK
ncbi:uncharacterized protein LOC143227036 isoform X1 [Tachypleus tridentatus]|uniref:uncharacterized protein LOC143227036 isoform X1 n=2 Tax=Tachypleus tridentatus TaxID=6853 RepID=UPI003FD3A78C